MGKERFEEIKHFVDLIDFIPRDDRGMGEMDVNNVKNDMEWLIGRVQELEQELHFCQVTKLSMDSVEKYTEDLKKQNRRYREVIEKIKKTSDDYRAGHLLDIQDSFFVDEIIAIINKLEESE